MMTEKRKILTRVAVCMLLIWAATLGIHFGAMPSGIPVGGTKDVDFWEEFLDEKRSLYLSASMEVPRYQVGIPFLFTYSGGAMPASVDLFLTTDQKHKGGHVVIEEVTITYEDGQSGKFVRKENPRAGILSELEVFPSDQRENREFYAARISIPHCIDERQDFTLNVVGYIQWKGGKQPFNEDVRILYSRGGYVTIGWVQVLLKWTL
ncbi:MAG: hypothetical protein IID44_00200 [Planctomycetes bacterium]|nr:hypothetical protein [Planctomycetota bacterium]